MTIRLLVQKYLRQHSGPNSATPTLNNALRITNYGEIVRDFNWIPYYIYNYDEESGEFYIFNLDDPENSILNPDDYTGIYQRFVDTSSSIDIVGFKHSFVNLPGIENPSFSVKFFCSDNSSAAASEWQQVGYVQGSNNIVFFTNVKRYLKVEIEFNSESSLSEANFLFLIQVNIDEIAVPVITDHARNVLSRFPSWTKIFSDSLEKSTPELATPDSKAGAIVNALLGEDLDNIDRLVSDINIDSFISTADINQVAWLYVIPSIRPGFIKIFGDSIELARVSSYYDLLQQEFDDFVFYYDFITQEVYSIRPFNEVLIDGISYNQIAVQNYNSFDEFGLRVALQRLYLESNLNFKKRILDVYLNPPSVDVEGLKRTLRRELDIWRAYGSTPDSNYVGATPEIIEITDFQKYDGIYFSEDGTPSSNFYDLVERLNQRFPSNYGYAKWEDSYWDYAGLKQEGVSSIPQVTDVDNLSGEDYQSGIGDFDDLKIVLEPLEKGIEEYSFSIKAKGIKSDSTQDAHEPIKVAYDSYISYYDQYLDHQAATINYEIYLKLDPHGEIGTSKVYKASVTDYVKNFELQTHSSSPEYMVKEIFGPSLFSNSDLTFFDNGGTPYYNVIEPSVTESYTLTQIPLYVVDQATVNFVSSQNSLGATANYGWIRFLDSTPSSIADATSNKIVKTNIQENADQMKLAISSRIWDGPKTRISQTEKVRSSIFGNTINQSGSINQKNSISINPFEIKKNFILPHGADPIYVHIENVVTDAYTEDLSSSPNLGYGGVSRNRDNQVDYLIPSSPNIIAGFINPDFATPNMHENYIGTSGSTVSYYFTNLKFPYDATPSSVFIEAASNNYYPFQQRVWEKFEAISNDEFSFYLSPKGVQGGIQTTEYDPMGNNQNNLVDRYNFYRSDFGLEEYNSSENLVIKSLEIINENDNVVIWQENEADSSNSFNLNYFDEDSSQYIIKDLNIRAKYDFSSEKNISPSIRSGWYYQNGEERFVYAKPELETSNNENEINLESIARNGSPIIVDVQKDGSTPVQYRQVSFYEEATPSNFSQYNFEYIIAKNSNSLYLSYSNVYDVKIVDTFTGSTVIENDQSNTNQINIISIPESPPLIIGREYKVTYKVRDSFYVDNQDYDSITDEYQTKVYLLSTPNGSYSATVTYESAVYDKDYELPELKLNPLYSPLDEGYIFLSHDSYEANDLDVYMSPKKIIADGVDYAVVNIFSKDTYGNPKPFQTFQISGSQITATPNYVTTDEDGFGKSKIVFSGNPTNFPYETNLNVSGLGSATPNAHPNSESSALTEQVNFFLEPTYFDPTKLIADTSKKIATSDGKEKIEIYGITDPQSKVYWRKARNLHAALTMPYTISSDTPGQNMVSGMVESDSDGKFRIANFITQNDATPGYWFVIVDSENASTPNSNPVTISGDIVYWYEKYDANQNSTEEPYYIPLLNESSDYSIYNEDPVFKADLITGDIFYDETASTPWSLPIWYPIKRFTQYQIGILGSTPNQIESFSGLHPDYEEE